MAAKMDRRDFLELLTTWSLASLPWPKLECQASGQVSAGGEASRNVIIVVFDALSARHLSLYGYARETTPNLVRLAREATVYHSHYAAGNFTVPGVASLLTGTYPWSHRALHHAGRVATEYEQQSLFALLGDSYSRVAFPHNIWTHLLLNQFREDIDVYVEPTAFSVFDDMSYSRLIPPGANIGYRSFQRLLFRDIGFPGSLVLSLINQLRTYLWKEVTLPHYKALYPGGLPALGPTTDVLFVLEDVIDGILSVTDSLRQPFLAYYHVFPPHDPYSPRWEFASLFDSRIPHTAKVRHVFSQGYSDATLRHKRREYDQYIANVDAEFGRLFDSLEASGVLDNTCVIVTSDHGELFERGIWGHDTRVLYEPVIHIPLVIFKPGQEERVDVTERTSCVDLVPTILQITAREIPTWCEGRVLPGQGGEPDAQRSLFSVEAKHNPAQTPLSTGTVALLRDNYKLIYYFGYEECESAYELYDLKNDPEELEDLYTTTHPIAVDMEEELRQKLREVNRPYG